MKTTIYYFTGTGNSLAVAKDLSSCIPDSVLVPLAGMKDYVCPSGRVGFVFPLYFWGLSGLVTEVVKKMDFSNVEYVFYVVTSGALKSPHFIKGVFDEVLSKYEKRLNSGFRILMPDNYITMIDSGTEEKNKSIIEMSKETVKIISKTINDNESNFAKDIKPFRAKLIHSLWKMNAGKSDKKYIVLEKCNSCEICAKACPVNNISMKDSRPLWNNRCEECMACIQFCPNEAIQTGKNTVARKRYHHPDVTVKDIIDQKRYE
jgi:ferredoxin